MNINIYSLPPLVGSLFTVFIGLIVYFKSKRSEVNFAFTIFSLSMFLWLFSYAVAYSVRDKHLGVFWCRLACTAVIFTAPAFYHLAVSYLKIKAEKRYIYWIHLIMLIFVFLFRTEYFLRHNVYRYFWGFYSVAGPLNPISLLVFSFVFHSVFLVY